MMKSSPSRFVVSRRAVLNGVLLFLIGAFAARLPATLAQAGFGSTSDFIAPIADAYRTLSRNYVESPDLKKLQTGAIDGMLEALGDDYAEYIPEEDADDFRKEMTGNFVGIGCQIEMRDGWLTVVSPLEDSPALAAGILANDRITSVEGKSTFGLTADDCVDMLTGEPDTKVSFIVERDGQEIPFTITRAPIISRAVRGLRRPSPLHHEPGVEWDYLIDPARRIAYIRLAQFTPSAAAELAVAIEEARRQAAGSGGAAAANGDRVAQLGGLILDLRNNPGGVMDGALEIADMFLASGAIMSVRGRSPIGGAAGGSVDGVGGVGAGETTYVARREGTLPDFPMVVLVNEGSASASEIVAGALSDHQRAVVVGTRSFGKGLVQTVEPLRSNPRAQIKYTTHRYYLPSGRLIQRTDDSAEWGVDPTPGFFIPMTDQERIESFMRRRNWDVLRRDAGGDVARIEQDWSDPVWVRDEAMDPQLAGAIEAITTRIATGDWKALNDEHQVAGKIADKEIADLVKARERLGLEFARIDKRIDALERVATEGAPEPERKDFWSDTLDLTGGRVRVFDKDGREVAELAVTGRDLERWLVNADLRKAGEPEPAAEPVETEKQGATP